MNIDRLRTLRQQLITPNNAEWMSVVNLRNLVRGEFLRQEFLTSQTYHTVLDWKLRRQRNRTERHREDNTEDLIRELTGTFWRVRHPTADGNPSVQMDLEKALARLRPVERLCVVLAYGEQMSHGEICSATGLPLGTVKSHISRGTARLRQYLADYEVGVR